MTRWARSGNSQKHKKMPGDATKWGEFDHQKAKSAAKEKTSIESNSKQNIKSTIEIKDPQSSNIEKNTSSENNRQFSLKPTTKDTFTANELEEKDKLENVTLKEGHKIEDTNNKNAKNSLSAKKLKKEKYLKKLLKKRTEQGIMLLPPNVERKLYSIKKKLREQGLPPPVLKEVIRKERRKAELQFRKTSNPSKLCFHCRQPGHVLAECPKKIGLSNQKTGICFKCGSVEHTSFKCPKKVQGFPFANCFICKEQGHISKDCPRNKHGVYPKGGRCNLCGNVNHLKKDCPSLNKKETVESTITLPTIGEEISIDAEIVEKKETKKKKGKKPKIVKF